MARNFSQWDICCIGVDVWTNFRAKGSREDSLNERTAIMLDDLLD